MKHNDLDILNQGILLFINGIENALNDFQIDKSNYPPLNIYIEKKEVTEKEIMNDVLYDEDIEIIENLIFEVAVAGFEPEKVKQGISLNNNILTIKVDKIEVEEDNQYLVKKLAFRQIDRSFKIPMAIREVDVEVNNGILKITLYPDTKKVNINIK